MFEWIKTELHGWVSYTLGMIVLFGGLLIGDIIPNAIDRIFNRKP